MRYKTRQWIKRWQLLLAAAVAFSSAIVPKVHASEQHYRAFFENSALPLSEPTHLAPLYDARRRCTWSCCSGAPG
ncbi:hypothetical protein ELY33_04395 [Vreelandella andesensis]|uniref:Uncharacterized protein n=1 Tax=Vreelandella andesensis TaxID=447567 RepID=A0A433KTE1_9GAMM|nr:hypothetical protein [Halomonas andesensis]RUR32856.1 hypothetical protein ELY33_04395 [Halomonas andesensis]